MSNDIRQGIVGLVAVVLIVVVIVMDMAGAFGKTEYNSQVTQSWVGKAFSGWTPRSN